MKNNTIKLIASAIVCMLFFSGCIKDKEYDNNMRGILLDKNSKLIEIAGPTDGFYSLNLNSSNADTTVNLVLVRLVSAEPAAQDIKVTLVLDTSLVSSYNAAHGTTFTIPDASDYSLPSLTVTIPKGSREGYLKIVTTPDNFIGTNHAIGFRLASVSDPSIKLSGNYNKQVIRLGVLNLYDGHYTVTGTMVDITNATLTGFYPLEWDLVTNGSGQVIVYDRDYTGTPTHIINTAAGLSQYGSFGLIVNFEPGLNKIVSVTNFYGQPASNGRSAQLDPSGENRFDPVTRTIKIKYFMLQPGSAIRTTFDETWTYVGPR